MVPGSFKRTAGGFMMHSMGIGPMNGGDHF